MPSAWIKSCAASAMGLALCAQASAVLELDSEASLLQMTRDSPSSMVKFYAPWCGHCKKLAPEYAEAAARLPIATFGKVDCTNEQLAAVCQARGADKYPTLIAYRSTGASAPVAVPYNGDRKAAGIVTFMQKLSKSAAEQVATEEQLRAVKGDEAAVVIGFFDQEFAQNGVKEAFFHVADSLRLEYTFLWSDNKELAMSHGASFPSISLLADFLHAPVAFPFPMHLGRKEVGAALAPAAVSEWLLLEGYPLLGDIGPANLRSYLDRGLPLAWLFDSETHPRRAELQQQVKEACAAFRHSLTCVRLSAADHVDYMEELGMAPHAQAQLGGLAITEYAARVKQRSRRVAHSSRAFKTYLLEGGLGALEGKDGRDGDGNAAAAFFQQFESGVLEPLYRAEEAVAGAEDNGVVRLTSSTLTAAVTEEGRDVFVLFTAPWCLFCKRAFGDLKGLAQEFAAFDSVVVASLDLSANEINFDVAQIPSFRYFPGGSANWPKGGLRYTSDHEQNFMSSFVRKHSQTLPQEERERDVLGETQEREQPEDQDADLDADLDDDEDADAMGAAKTEL